MIAINRYDYSDAGDSHKHDSRPPLLSASHVEYQVETQILQKVKTYHVKTDPK